MTTDADHRHTQYTQRRVETTHDENDENYERKNR